MSFLRYRLLRFREKGQNQRVAITWRHKSIEIDRLNCIFFFRFVIHSEARTVLDDNLTKIQSSNVWLSSWNALILHFPLCREKVTGMPRIETVFEVDMVFCFGIRLAPYVVFSIRIYLPHIARPVDSNRSINIVLVRPSIRPSDQSVRCLHEETSGLTYPLSTQQRLIRLGGCPGWSDRVFAGRTDRFVGFVVLWLIYYILVCLTWVNNTDFFYFDAFYFNKLPEKVMLFMYPCTCTLVSAYYVILQMNSSTPIYLSRRSTRDEWTK